MTKKIIGICLIAIGGLFFIINSYGVYQIAYQPEKLKANAEHQLVVKGLSQQQIDMTMMMYENSFKTFKVVKSIVAIVGLCTAIGGLVLLRKAKNDTKLTASFNFD
jgi:hypothetical protein